MTSPVNTKTSNVQTSVEKDNKLPKTSLKCRTENETEKNLSKENRPAKRKHLNKEPRSLAAHTTSNKILKLKKKHQKNCERKQKHDIQKNRSNFMGGVLLGVFVGSVGATLLAELNL